MHLLIIELNIVTFNQITQPDWLGQILRSEVEKQFFRGRV